ncbi:ribonuclease H-like domain-containing protein [Tanacetum coccineum]
MLTSPTPSSSPSRITSSPSLSTEPFTQPTFEPQPSPDAEYHVPTPNESPLHAVHSHGSDEGSLKIIELMNLVTKLSERIGVLEDDLKRTKQTYSAAFTKIILKIKKLESKVKTGKARKRARVVLSKDEEDDSSKHGRKISDIDEDLNTYFAQDDEVVHDQDTAEEGQPEDSTAGITVSTAPINISTARETRSTAGRVVYGRRSKEARKDKGKAIMTEPEPEKKSKKLLEQERLGLEEAIRLQEQVDEEERAQIARDEEIARQLLALDEERVTTKTKTTKKLLSYMKNQSNYKMKDFEGMSYDEIRPIFEKVWDFNHNFVPMDLEIEKEKKKPAEFQEIEEEQIEKDTSKKTTGKRKKYLPRRRTRSTAKKQKVEQDDEKEELKKTYTLSENFMYYKIIRGDGSSKNYKILSEMLYDFDRQDVVELYRLVKERDVTILLMVNAADLEIRMQKDKYGLGSTSGIRACALRNFDLEVMELENTQNNALAKLPMLKLGEYEMWEIRIKQYFQIQDYALWEVIENGNSWVPIPVTTPSETGTSTATKMTMPSTTEEKTCKKNDVKARSLLLMALPNEHQLTFDQYVDAQSMFAAIKARFGGNEATKKTQKALLKQQYENFSASSSESLDSIFNRLQKLVSRLAILGVVTPPEDLNVKFLRSLPSEWDTHVVVWMNKPDFDTMGLDDLYNNFKIVEQKVKKSAGASNDDKNLAFVTTSGASSTNNINTVNPEVSTATTKVNTASTEICTASFSDATVYAFLSTQPKGSQLVHEDLEQLHDDDLEEMDLKWNMALLSMRARKFYQRTGRKIIIDGSNTAGYDKSKVECFNCHKMGHFARECRAPRSKDNRNWNQGSSTKTVKIEDASKKAMCAIDDASFDWSDMAEEEIQANMTLMAFSDSEVLNDKSCSKNCLKNYEALKKQYDDLLVKLSDTDFKAATYKRGLTTLEGQIVKYKELKFFLEEIALLKECSAKFDKSAKRLKLNVRESLITGQSKNGVGLEELTNPESDNSKENTDDSLEQHQMTNTETSSFESPLKVDKDWKEKFFYPANNVESVNQIEKPVKRTVRYADKSLVKEQESQLGSMIPGSIVPRGLYGKRMTDG